MSSGNRELQTLTGAPNKQDALPMLLYMYVLLSDLAQRQIVHDV